jgi:hypothetical protein
MKYGREEVEKTLMADNKSFWLRMLDGREVNSRWPLQLKYIMDNAANFIAIFCPPKAAGEGPVHSCISICSSLAIDIGKMVLSAPVSTSAMLETAPAGP